MPDLYITKRTRRVYAGGKIKVTLPEFKITLPAPKEIAKLAAEHIERRLIERLGQVPSAWAGFAAWLRANLQVREGGVEWPDNAAVERMNLMGLEPRWLDEAIELVLKDAIK